MQVQSNYSYGQVVYTRPVNPEMADYLERQAAPYPSFEAGLADIRERVDIRKDRPIVGDEDGDPDEVDDKYWLEMIHDDLSDVESALSKFIKQFSIPTATLEQLDLIVKLDKFGKRATRLHNLIERHYQQGLSTDTKVQEQLIEAYEQLASEWPL